MKINKLKIILLLVFSCFYIVDVFAQDDLDEEIDIVQYYKPILGDAIKIRKTPSFDDAKNNKSTQQYTAFDNSMSSYLAADSSNVVVVDSTEIIESHPLVYAKFGAGNLSSKLGDLVFSSNQNEKNQYGFNYNSYGAKGDIEHQDVSRHNMIIFASHIGEKFTTSVDMQFKQQKTYYYGYDHSLYTFEDEDILHRMSSLGTSVELVNNKKNADSIDYTIRFGGWHYKDNNEAKEGTYFLNTFFTKQYSGFNANVIANLDFNNSRDVNVSHQNNFIKINPYVDFVRGKFSSKVGFNIISNFGSEGAFKVYPNLYTEYTAIERYFSIYGGLNGDLKKNTYVQLNDKNHFLAADQQIKNTDENVNIYVGSKGTIVNGLGYNLQFKYTNADNIAMYVNSPMANSSALDPQYMNVAYSGDGSSQTTLSASLNYSNGDKFKINFDAELYTYNFEDYDHASYLPSNKINLSGVYNINRKLAVNIDLFSVGSQYALTDMTTQSYVKLSGYADMNIGANYRFYKNFGAFIHFNNIFNNSYQKYMNYYNYGFNCVGGLSIII